MGIHNVKNQSTIELKISLPQDNNYAESSVFQKNIFYHFESVIQPFCYLYFPLATDLGPLPMSVNINLPHSYLCSKKVVCGWLDTSLFHVAIGYFDTNQLLNSSHSDSFVIPLALFK